MTQRLSKLSTSGEIKKFGQQTVIAVGERFGQGRTGGYLYICDSKGHTVLHVELGHPDPEKKEKYRAFSREKAWRLHKYYEHILSRQSRCEKKEQYGGAIRLPSGHIISFSGFPELIDEAYCAGLVRVMGCATAVTMKHLKAIEGNSYFDEVHDVVYAAIA